MEETAASLIRSARGTTPQADLAIRVGLARETIARWESGSQEPSLDSLRSVIRAAGFELRTELVPAHETLIALVDQHLAEGPTNRLRQLMAEDWAACQPALRLAATTFEHSVLVGPIAAAIRGAPQRPSGPSVDLLAPPRDLPRVERLLHYGDAERVLRPRSQLGPNGSEWLLNGAVITLRSHAPGLEDVDAVRDRSPWVSMTYAEVPALRVALVEDLLDLAEYATRPEDRELVAGLRAVLASGRYSARIDRKESTAPR
jgi:transcriptional regulator with XRE-family HTH domain